jgi:hypothetical protein
VRVPDSLGTAARQHEPPPFTPGRALVSVCPSIRAVPAKSRTRWRRSSWRCCASRGSVRLSIRVMPAKARAHLLLRRTRRSARRSGRGSEICRPKQPAHQAARRPLPSSSRWLKATGYRWSYLVCRIGHSVPIRQLQVHCPAGGCSYTLPSAPPSLKPTGYGGSYLSCRLGHLILFDPVWQLCTGPLFPSCTAVGCFPCFGVIASGSEVPACVAVVCPH